jgi:DNA polymerase-3 subunit epsilon
MKYCYIDVETGGVDFKENPLLQIAGIIEIYSDEGEITEEEKFNYFIKPFDGDKVDPKALAVNELTQEDIDNFDSPKSIFLKFRSLLEKYVDPFNRADKFFFLGYNAIAFDMPFVREFWHKNRDNYFGSWFFYPAIDVMALAAEKLKEQRWSMANFKLPTVAKELEITVEKGSLHDALYDIELTREVYKEVIK